MYLHVNGSHICQSPMLFALLLHDRRFTILRMVQICIAKCDFWFVWHFSHEIWHEVISRDPALLAKTEMHVLFPNMIPWPINHSHAVREVTQSQPPPSPQSSTTTYTRSHSLVFWSPAHAEHQSSQLQSTLHPVDLRLVCSLPRTVLGSLVRLTCLYSPSSFLTILLSYSSDSPTLIPLVPGLLSFSKPAKTDSHYSPKLSKDWFQYSHLPAIALHNLPSPAFSINLLGINLSVLSCPVCDTCLLWAVFQNSLTWIFYNLFTFILPLK